MVTAWVTAQATPTLVTPLPPHLNNVSTLPCETKNAHRSRATIEWLKKETTEFIPSYLRPSNSPDLNSVDYSVREMLQEKMFKIRITDLDELKQRLRTKWQSGSSLRQPFVNGIVSRSGSVTRFVSILLQNCVRGRVQVSRSISSDISPSLP